MIIMTIMIIMIITITIIIIISSSSIITFCPPKGIVGFGFRV